MVKAMSQDSICTNDTIAKLPSGDLPIRYSGAPLKDAEGKIIGGLEYVLDISNHHAVESIFLVGSGASLLLPFAFLPVL